MPEAEKKQVSIHEVVFRTRRLAEKYARGLRTYPARGGYMVGAMPSFTVGMNAALAEKHQIVASDPKEQRRLKNRAKRARQKAAGR